ncbi:hypothetical protein BCR34DRAFT_570920 [Clohesyomyces aquaticus]|uniref:Uncharacterized protein n=1 Tax=Clohesyomyces aquaticus TaxID=1231657 RepID=A0A1Y1Z9S4_9PLEO|nr:hypothetical protein BCR34DRAFT_570920 [Clohesyomyces aquaticus]
MSPERKSIATIVYPYASSVEPQNRTMAVIPPLTKYVNLGPLPTAVSFPASCTNTLYDLKHTYLGLNEFVPTAGCALKECCPSGKYYTEDWAWYTSYFSPAVCPQDYTSCPGPISPIILSTAPGETVSFCCPRGYGCPMLSPFYGACGSGLSSRTTTLLVLDDLNHQSSLSSRSYYSTDQNFQNWAVAYPIQVRMGGSPTDTTSAITQSSEHTPPSTTSTGGANLATESKGSASLSTGAIVGIAFGGFFSIAFLALAVLWILRRRHNLPVETPDPQPPPVSQLVDMSKFNYQGAPSQGVPYQGVPYQVAPYQTAPMESPAYPQGVQEMPYAPQRLWEMPANADR